MRHDGGVRADPSSGAAAQDPAVDVPAVWVDIYHYAWFVSFALALGVYVVLTWAVGRTPARECGVQHG